MDEEDDDLYDPADLHTEDQATNGEVKMAELEEGEEEDENADESDDVDDINFITDAKGELKQEAAPQVKRQVSTSIPPRTGTPADHQAKMFTPISALKHEITSDQKGGLTPERPGTDYPGRHTSTIDPNANPIHPATGRPILSTDFDTDFPSESTKPWRKPGSDISDYFNYGFDEFTWASYCLKQQQMPKEITEINKQAESMKAFVEGIGNGGLPGLPAPPAAPQGSGAMPGMPGMPSEAEMQQMFATMVSQGIDPASLDQNQFMQMMMGGAPGGASFGGQAGGFGGQPVSQQQQGGFGGGGGGGGGGYRGRGRGRW